MINEKGKILAFQLNPGNVADVSIAETLSKGIFGKLFGDKGEYFERIFKEAFGTRP